MTSLYAQDTYTRDRLTLQGGLRYDGIGTGYPDTGAGGPDYQLMPTPLFWPAGTTDEIHWKDLTPRLGAAYDLFGNGRTAAEGERRQVPDRVDREQQRPRPPPADPHRAQYHPPWNDTPAAAPANGNFVPDCDLRATTANGECGAMDNQNFGRETFTKTFDPDLIHGWGKRTYNWEMGVSVQHELMPRLGVTVGYFRRSFGNFYTANNRNTTTADYTPFSIPIPAIRGCRRRWRNGLGPVQPGTAEGRERGPLLAALRELWRDDGKLARHRRERQRAAAQRSTVQGGASTGRRLQDNCDVRAALPETYSWASTTAVQTTRVITSTGALANPWCRVVEPAP